MLGLAKGSVAGFAEGRARPKSNERLAACGVRAVVQCLKGSAAMPESLNEALDRGRFFRRSYLPSLRSKKWLTSHFVRLKLSRLCEYVDRIDGTDIEHPQRDPTIGSAIADLHRSSRVLKEFALALEGKLTALERSVQ
jgi:hypothetical protein